MAKFVSTNPDKIGTGMSVADETELANLPVGGFTLGSYVYCVGTNKTYQLIQSTASLAAGLVVAVSGVTGMRWVAPGNTTQAVTTTGATDTVTMAVGAKLLVVTFGVDSTSFTLAGLDLDTDFRYVLQCDLAGGGTFLSLLPNGTSNASSFRQSYVSTTFGGGAGSPAANFRLIDATDAATVGGFVATIAGAAGAHKTLVSGCNINNGGVTYSEYAVGQTVATTNVTSLVIIGTIKAGTVMCLQRTM